MTGQKTTFRDRVTALRRDPRIAAFSLIGPGGQIFALVDELVAELERHEERLARLERIARGVPTSDDMAQLRRINGA